MAAFITPGKEGQIYGRSFIIIVVTVMTLGAALYFKHKEDQGAKTPK